MSAETQQIDPPGSDRSGSGGERVAERLGPYRLVQRIGEGGMGVVHLALDPTGRAVAIKVLRAHIAYDADARARLEREVDTLARVTHPRVAPVIDANLHGDRPYVVTRFVAGDALDDHVAEHGPLHGEALVGLARGLFGALEAIHAVGVVHRDLKPGNVLLDDDGEPVVIDFGIAHVADDVRLTSNGLVMGTPGYLAPEIVEGSAVTEATDWWGWAATLVFAATGRPPFGRGPMDVVLARVRAGEFDLAGVDPRLEPLLAAALSPHPGDRPPADLVLAALERYAAGAAATDVFPAGGAGAAWAGAGGASGAGPAGGAARPSSPSTRVMPVAGLAGAVEPARSPMPQPAPAPPHDWRREQWQPGEWEPAPAWPAEPQWVGQPLRGPAGGVGLSGPAGAHDPAATRHTSAGFGEPGAVEVDPRIGRPDRTGPLTALAGLFVALVAVAPVIGVAAAVLWSWVARVADRSVTSLVLRRFENGRRRSDLPVTVAMAPVHVLGGAFAAVLAGALPLLVGGAGMLCVALAMSASGRPSSPIAGPLGLAVGMVLAIVTGWWGPGGASLRRGSKSLARGFAPTGGMVADVVVGVLVVAALAVVGWGVVRGWVPLWWPLPGAPSWVR